MSVEIIAEIGQNHNGDMSLAKELIAKAKESGADVAKFQLFDAQKLFTRDNNPWYDYNLKTEISRKQVDELYKICSDLDIEFMATPFDVERVDWLESLNVKRYKIASRSIHDRRLIDKILMTGKPVIVSLGMWNNTELPEIKGASVDFLYCISEYPTQLEKLNFSAVDFKKYSGFSDHTMGIIAALTAVARGARIIEKHFTLDKTMHGPDHMGSMDVDDLNQLVRRCQQVSRCL